MFETATNVPALVTEGTGHPRVNGAFATINMMINVALLFPALKVFGIQGVAGVWLLSQLLVAPAFLNYAQRHIVGLGWTDTLRRIYFPSLGTIRGDVRDVAKALVK